MVSCFNSGYVSVMWSSEMSGSEPAFSAQLDKWHHIRVCTTACSVAGWSDENIFFQNQNDPQFSDYLVNSQKSQKSQASEATLWFSYTAPLGGDITVSKNISCWRLCACWLKLKNCLNKENLPLLKCAAGVSCVSLSSLSCGLQFCGNEMFWRPWAQGHNSLCVWSSEGHAMATTTFSYPSVYKV